MIAFYILRCIFADQFSGRTTAAMAAGLERRLWHITDIATLIEQWEVLTPNEVRQRNYCGSWGASVCLHVLPHFHRAGDD